MDPVLAAKKLIDSLVEEELKNVQEAKENEDSVDENETEQNDMESDSNQASQNQGSVAMKPTGFSGVEKGGINHDAHGSEEQDAHGGKDRLDTMQYQDYSGRNRASIAMKPSFATAGSVSPMSEEQIRNDIMSIFGSEELSEEFMNKAGSLYESAVLAKAEEVIYQIHEQYENAFNEEVESIKDDLSEKVDSYLNYVVGEWMEENKLAIENGIRTEIAENFIDKLKNLFLESYIEVPQNKTNLFDEMAETIEALEQRVNEEMEKNVAIINENKAVYAVSIFNDATKHLTDGEVDKVARLAENIEFISEDDFKDKIQTLVENMKKVPIKEQNRKTSNNKYLTEETIIEDDDSDDVVSTDSSVQFYSDVITRMMSNN
jgi:hypothetical protein